MAEYIDLETLEPLDDGDIFIQNTMTNADQVRAMTDEEIENWYWWMYKEMTYYTDSRAFVHNWLKQEVDNGRT